MNQPQKLQLFMILMHELIVVVYGHIDHACPSHYAKLLE